MWYIYFLKPMLKITLAIILVLGSHHMVSETSVYVLGNKIWSMMNWNETSAIILVLGSHRMISETSVYVLGSKICSMINWNDQVAGACFGGPLWG